MTSRHSTNPFGKIINVFFFMLYPWSGTIPDGIHNIVKLWFQFMDLRSRYLGSWTNKYHREVLLIKIKVTSYNVASQMIYE
jgi:hypothetical protein